jgi:hypothetical protein
LLPKTYFVDGFTKPIKSRDGSEHWEKMVMKGFESKKIKHFKLEDFEETLYLTLQKLTKEIRKDGYSAFRIEKPKAGKAPKFMETTLGGAGLLTFKAALTEGKLLAKKPEYTRAIRSAYDKRELIRVGKNLDTRAIHLS